MDFTVVNIKLWGLIMAYDWLPRLSGVGYTTGGCVLSYDVGGYLVVLSRYILCYIRHIVINLTLCI